MQKEANHQKKASQLIRGLTPPKSRYDAYVDVARYFKREFNDLNRLVPEHQRKIQRLEMMTSKTFGQKYLVGFITRDWMAQIAPHCNAIASPSVSFIDLSSPPLVLIPGSTLPRGRQFSFILEHEFVHVNQAILGRFPNLSICELSEGAMFLELINVVQAEFEANFIQLVHDPKSLSDNKLGVSLEKWCLLRGYAQGIEEALLRMTSAGLPLDRVKKFVGLIDARLPSEFKKANLNNRIGQEFVDDLEYMVQVALLNIQKSRPEVLKNPGFMGVFKWAFRNWKASSSSDGGTTSSEEAPF